MPADLVQTDPAPIDLSRATLRSVSPVHLAYLRNMQVRASMSVSIIRDDALWGLVACHHREPRYVPPEQRQACVLLAQLAAWQLTVVEQAQAVRRSAGVKAIETTLLHEATLAQDDRGRCCGTVTSCWSCCRRRGWHSAVAAR